MNPILILLAALFVAFYYGVYTASSSHLMLFGQTVSIPPWLQKG